MTRIGTAITRHITLSGAACMLLATVLDASRAEACSYPAPEPAWVGYPEDGATDVPTDVIPFYDVEQTGLYVYDASTGYGSLAVELVATSGEIIALTSVLPRVGELFPRAELEPRTRYVLRPVGSEIGDGSLQLSFTTGDGPLMEAPRAPDIGVQHYTLESPAPTSCSPAPYGTCVFFSPEPAMPGSRVESTPFDSVGGFDSFPYLIERPWFFNLSGIEQGHPFDCIEARTRASNGTYSDVAVVCRDDGPRYDLYGSEQIGCTAAGLTQEGQLVSTLGDESSPLGSANAVPAALDVDRSGCSFTTPGGSSSRPRAPTLAYAVLALWSVVIRRKGAAAWRMAIGSGARPYQ
jgi:hypothetical protein